MLPASAGVIAADRDAILEKYRSLGLDETGAVSYKYLQRVAAGEKAYASWGALVTPEGKAKAPYCWDEEAFELYGFAEVYVRELFMDRARAGYRLFLELLQCPQLSPVLHERAFIADVAGGPGGVVTGALLAFRDL